MHISAVLTAWIALAVVLALSGVGKLRDPDAGVESATALGVPPALARPGLLRLHPWVELLLAVLLLTAPHPLSVPVAVLVLLLMLGYLLLIGRALATDQEVTCTCFGALGSSRVDRWALLRNVVLTLGAVLLVVDAVLGGSAVQRYAELGRQWWWVAGVVVAVVLALLVARPSAGAVSRGASRLSQGSGAAGAWAPTAPVLRLPVPDVPVQVAEGEAPVSLRDLGDGRDQLLLLLSPGCGPCRMIARQVPTWAATAPEVDIRVSHRVSFAAVRESLPEWEPYFVQDVHGALAAEFDDPARPWAVLLGADGRLASAPAQGLMAIEALVAEMLAARAGREQAGTR